MPEYCTCGAELPPDARFCHKCGKPQRDEPVLVEEPPAPPPVVAPPAPLQPSGQLNLGLALRTALLTAAILFLLNLIAAEAVVVWLLAIGFLAVFFYQRRGGRLSLGGGARLGWITGLTSFVLFGLPSLVLLATRPDYLRTVIEELKKNSAISPALRDRMMEALQQMPLGLLLMAALVMLVMFSVFPLIGGLIGAKILKKSS